MVHVDCCSSMKSSLVFQVHINLHGGGGKVEASSKDNSAFPQFMKNGIHLT